MQSFVQPIRWGKLADPLIWSDINSIFVSARRRLFAFQENKLFLQNEHAV
jgi:hypothetical protein